MNQNIHTHQPPHQPIRLPSIDTLLTVLAVPKPQPAPPPVVTLPHSPLQIQQPPSPPAAQPSRSSSTSASSSSSSHATTNTRKRQRKRFEDVQRLFFCDYKNCHKGYGSLTHLNEHRVIQKHGARKKIDDFKHVKLLQDKLNSQKKRSASTSSLKKNHMGVMTNPKMVQYPIAVVAAPGPPPLPPHHIAQMMGPSRGITNLSNFVTTPTPRESYGLMEPRIYMAPPVGALPAPYLPPHPAQHIQQFQHHLQQPKQKQGKEEPGEDSAVVQGLLQMKGKK